MKFEEKGPINVLSKTSVKKAAKSLLVATVIASQVFTVLPTGSFAAEATGQESTTPTLPTADQAASRIAIEPMSLALDNGVTEKRAQVSTFAEFKAAAESTTINVIEITGNFQFTSNVSINSNIRIEGNGYAVTAGSYQMIMRSTSIVDVQDLSITNVGTKGVFTGYNSTAAPTVNLTNNVQVFGMIMGGTGKLSLSIGGTNNKIVSPDQYGMDVDDLIIEDNTRIEELSALNTAVKVRSAGAVSIGDNAYINMNSSKGYAFDVSTSALVIGENTVLKSASKYGTVRAATLVVKNGADLTLASGDVGYGIYVTGNITIGDDVKLKATGTGTAVYAYNTGASIVVGKNANVDIVSDNGHGFYGNASITFGDGSSLKLRTQYKGIYSAGAAPIRFGTVSNQPKAAADRVKIDIDSGIDYGIYSAGGPVIFGDDTEVNVKAKAGSIYAGGNSRVNFGSNTKTTISSSAGTGVNAGGVVFGDDSTVSINAYTDGINTTDTSGEGLSTGKNVSMNITANNHDGIYTYKNTTFGENNTVVIKALNSHAIHSLYGSAINIGANSSFDLSGTDGVRQEATAASALNVGTNSTLKIAAADYGIYTSGSVTFATGSKANIRAASKSAKPAVKANGVVTFQKDTMAYVESLYPSTTTSVFDLSGAANSKLVLNSPKFIDFRQNNNNATTKTGHIVKGYGTATVANQSRVEINNVTNLMAWNHGTDWSKASNSAWTNVDSGRVTLSNKNGAATTSYYGGLVSGTGLDGFSLFDYTRLSTEGSSAIDRPVVNPIYVGAKTVTGTGTSGNDVIVTFPNGTTAKATVGQDGKWTVDVPAGVNLAKNQSVVSYQTNGVNDSANVTTKVQQDLSVPGTPDVDGVKEGDTVLKGKGEPNKEITVTLPDGSKVTGNTDANGDFAINIPAQKEDAVLQVTQKGDNGLDSPAVEVIVASNQKPVITADDQTFRVGDTFSPLAGVTATDKEDGNLTADVTVKSSNVDMTKVGNYTVVYTVTDKDGNTTEKTITIKVIAATAGTITAGDFTIGTDNYVKGIYTGDVAKMYLEVNGVKLTTISATGSPYQYYANGSITKATDQVFIVALDANGKELQKTSVKVNAKVTAGTITAEDYTVGTNYVKGTLTGDVVKAALEVNGVVKQAIDVSNPYQYYAKDKVLNATDAVYIIGYDASGKVLQRTKVNVKSSVVTKGTITPANYVLGTDTYVKGTFTGDVAKVSITVNGVVKQTINTPTSPFQYYAKDKILNLTDIVTVTAYDSTGKVLDTKPVTITANNGQPGTITANSFKLGKDSYVTGTRTGDVQKVELVVNGVVQQRIDVTAQPAGTYQYYAKGKILNSTDVVTMNAYNSAGVLVNTKVVSISTSTGTVTANTFVVGKDGYVTGKLTGDVTKIALRVNGVLKSAVPKTAGDYEYYAKDKISSVTDVVEVIAYDATGAVLNTTTVSLTQQTAPVTKGTVTPQAFKIGTNSYVDGTYTGDVAKVELEVNGTKYGQIPANGNVIHYYAAGLITDGTDDVKVNVYDTTGKLLDSKPVTINVATGTVNASPVKVGDSYLYGTATGDVYKVVLSVNGVLKTSPAFVNAADGTYKYFIRDLNLQPTDVVEVIGQDSRGGQINTNTVTITQ